MGAVKYPAARKRLLELMLADQRDRHAFQAPPPGTTESDWMRADWMRADELLEIIARIRVPSANNIGLDGSRASWLIALHSNNHRGAARLLLSRMRYLYYKEKSQVFYPGIPYLVDSLLDQKAMLRGCHKQRYGTIASYVSYHEKLESERIEKVYRVPITGLNGLTERRRKYGLDTGRCTHVGGDAKEFDDSHDTHCIEFA